MTQTYLRGPTATLHRIDVPCEQTGFTTPPFNVHIKFLPGPNPRDSWTLLAHAAAGKPQQLARWLIPHIGIENVEISADIAPKFLRAKSAALPKAWAKLAATVKVHHLNLGPDGHASWFIEGSRDQVWTLVQQLEWAHTSPASAPLPSVVRCRPVHVGQAGGGDCPISRRQFETLSMAVALGYYEIPHSLDLRALATHAGISLGSVSELLRRAEGAVLTHYVDSKLLLWPAFPEGSPQTFRSMENLVRF